MWNTRGSFSFFCMRMDPFSYLQTRMNQLWREFDKEFAPIIQKFTPASTTTASPAEAQSAALTTMPTSTQSLAAWLPSSVRLDVSESANEISVIADLPGFPRDSIKATVDDSGMLHIRASKQEEISQPVSEGGQEWTWRERHSGSVQRSIQLPASVDSQAAHAQFRDGVLTLKFNKKAEKKGHLIDIK